MAVSESQVDPVEVFVSYAHEDREFLASLEPHLALLQRAGRVSLWHDGQILPGSEWRREIDQRLESAGLFLLLVSADFLASDYCWGVEMKRALQRHAEGSAIVIPVVVRPCVWDTAPFAELQALPTGAKAVTTWEQPDAAYADIASGLTRAIERLSPSG